MNIDRIEDLIREPDFERLNREARQSALRALERDTSRDPKFPWKQVADAVGTMGSGQLVTLAGCDGNGKTAVLGNVANGLLDQGVPWVYFGLELADYLLVQFLAALRVGLPRYKVVEGLLTEPERQALAGEVESLIGRTGGMHFVPEARLTAKDVVARVRQLVREMGTRVAFLDHLHHLDYTAYGSNLRIGINDAMHELKVCANETGVTFLIACQLARRSGDLLQPWRVPSTSELKESGAISQLSDVVLFVHRQVRADARDAARAFARGEGSPADFEHLGRLAMTVGKHRFGRRTGVTIPLTIHYPTDRITEATADTWEQVNPEDRPLRSAPLPETPEQAERRALAEGA